MNAQKIQEAYAQKRKAEEEKKTKQEEQSNRDKATLGSDLIQKAVLKSAAAQIEAMSVHEPKVEVKNLGDAVDAINKLNLTNFTTSQPRIADMIENLEKLSVEMAQLSEKFKEIGFEPVSNALTQLLKQIDGLPKKISDITVKIEKDKNVEKALSDLKDSIDKIEFSPKINVSVPDVKVPKIDISPITEVLSKKEDTEESVDLECYKAQDLDDNNPGFQYIGFVNPEGNWYIIENDTEGNALRYAFGLAGYSDAWNKHMEFSYRTLDEAINAIQA